MKKNTFSYLKKLSFDRSDLIVVMLLMIGIFLRLWQLETRMIFFADAGRDMLAAVEMNTTGKIPLLGIPSSVPRFKQGPLFVWFSGLIFLVTGPNPLMVGYSMAIINCLALVICYLLVKKYVNTSAALVTLLLLATSPLAIAHSRMPYHITPIIIFFLVYLFALIRLAEKKKWSVFAASLSWALLFQFELALFPMILLIVYTCWKKKYWKGQHILEGMAGLIIGLLPQIIYDLTHWFGQLGGFIAWIGYRVLSFFLIGKAHAFSLDKLQTAWTNFLLFFSRIFSVDHPWIGIVFLLLLIFSLVIIWKNFHNNIFLQQVWLALLLLLLAFVVHGSPSEAYFPPIILLSIICIGCATSFMARKTRLIVCIAISILASYNIVQIGNNTFFTLPASTDFQYGPSYQEQKQVMRFILRSSQGHPYELKSTDPESQFVSYLDNFRILGLYLQEQTQVQVDYSLPKKTFFINKPDSELVTYPLAKITFFKHLDVIQLPENP